MASRPEIDRGGLVSPLAVTTPVTTADILNQRMPRVDALTGLRWWAAFFVFTYHMAVFAPLPDVVAGTLRYGYFGVTFFFVLSGFVLMWSYTASIRHSTFYWRRFARIYPSHVVALAIAIPVFYTLSPVPEGSWLKPISVGALLLSLTLLHGWSRDPEVFFSGNPAAWSLTYEAFFYAAFPFVARIITPSRRRGALMVAVGVVFLMFGYRLLCALYPDSILPSVPWPVQHLTEFVLGMAVAWAFRCGWLPRIPGLLALGALVAAIAGIVLSPQLFGGTWVAAVFASFANEIVTVACAVAILGVASHSMRGRRSLLASRPLVRLGEWSFAFYLVHASFIYLALTVFGLQPTGWQSLMWYPCILFLSIAGAAGLHLLVEKPLERRMRTWKDERDRRASETAARGGEAAPASLP